MIGFCLCDGYLDSHSWLPNKSSNLITSLSINPAHDCFVWAGSKQSLSPLPRPALGALRAM